MKFNLRVFQIPGSEGKIGRYPHQSFEVGCTAVCSDRVCGVGKLLLISPAHKCHRGQDIGNYVPGTCDILTFVIPES
jgi:hypothetical protein